MPKKQTKAQEPAPQTNVVSGAIQLPSGFRQKRMVTVPTLTMKEAGAARILRFDEKMRRSNYVDPDPKKAKEKPATVAPVTDMESGEVFQFLVPSVVESNLRRDYDGGKFDPEEKEYDDSGTHSYVGKIFRIQCQGKRPNKRYRDFSIVEVEQG